VFGEVNGREEEVVAFAASNGHHITTWLVDHDQYVALDTTANGDPFQWTLERLRTRLPAMLIERVLPTSLGHRSARY